MAEYATVIGFVQFPVAERALDSGDTVRDVTVRPAGVDAPLIRATLWPEFADVDVNEGDLVAIDGAYTERTAQGKDGSKQTYRNMNTKRIAVVQASAGSTREVVNKGGRAKAKSF